MSELRVNAIRHTGASSDAVTLATDGTCTAKITNNLSNRNLVINGGMAVNQRGSSSGSSGFKTVDRWAMWAGGANAALTQTQHDLTSSDTGPWEKGFRRSYHILNAGQSGPDAGDYILLQYLIEAQDIANSGWDYTSASSYITLSYWVKSSVAQNFYPYIRSVDGTGQNYTWADTLSANTWTKITKKIPGNSNLTFNNDNGNGFMIQFVPFFGTDFTGTVTQNQWAAYNSSARTPDSTSTWWTTSNATFEITGIQLEVGDVATDFEHRSYGDELARCQRYYQSFPKGSGGYGAIYNGYTNTSTRVQGAFLFPVEMRTTPTFASSGNLRILSENVANTVTSITSPDLSPTSALIQANTGGSLTTGQCNTITRSNDATAKITLTAEL